MVQRGLWDEPVRKRCSACGHLKPLDEFNRRTAAADGRQWNCRECNRSWHTDNKAHHNRLIRARAMRIREEYAARILAYLLDHACVDCGEHDPVVLDFDHLRDKVSAVSRMAMEGHSWSTIEAEMAKCEVVCANCHRRRTAYRAQTFRYRATRFPSARTDSCWPGATPLADTADEAITLFSGR